MRPEQLPRDSELSGAYVIGHNAEIEQLPSGENEVRLRHLRGLFAVYELGVDAATAKNPAGTIDSRCYITDAQLNAAYGDDCLRASSYLERLDRLRRVAEFAIAAYLGSTLPERFEQLDRVINHLEENHGVNLR